MTVSGFGTQIINYFDAGLMESETGKILSLYSDDECFRSIDQLEIFCLKQRNVGVTGH